MPRQFRVSALRNRVFLHRLSLLFLSALLMIPSSAFCVAQDWSVGGYGGKYYDTEPAGFTQGKANYSNHYIVALTANKTFWRAEVRPLALEIDGMIGHQFGLATIDEIAIAPVLNWSGFPWNDLLQTNFRFGPLGVSYTSAISPLERGTNNRGSHFLNYLIAELGFSLPRMKAEEVFLRLHHRCSSYDLLNNYGANGEDFFAMGYRHHF